MIAAMKRKLQKWWQTPQGKITITGIILLGVLLGITAVTFLRDMADPRSSSFIQWATGSQADRDALITVQRTACTDAPFILPTDGFIGLLYADPRGPYNTRNPHQGIDIFSDSEPGIAPVYAAYDGYVTRESTWRSALIIRIPEDPLNPKQQIWLYYTHMADQEGNSFIVDAIPPGTQELFVPQGTLLGYTGNYNGSATRQIWTHLHFSIVQDDGNGRYTNELEFTNTLDPSPYLGMALNYRCAPITVGCTANPLCDSS